LLILKKGGHKMITRQIEIEGKKLEIGYECGFTQKKYVCRNGRDIAAKVHIKIYSIKFGGKPISRDSKLGGQAISLLKKEMGHGTPMHPMDWIYSLCSTTAC
jgi:hypothetical protein